MKVSTRLMVVTIAILSGLSIAAAATNKMSKESGAKPVSMTPKDKLSLTKEQEKTAWQDISKQARKESVPAHFVAKVGVAVPGGLMTYPVPMTTSSNMPVLRRYQYALLENGSLLIVNPDDKKIADVITR
jgi:hypothetical protein